MNPTKSIVIQGIADALGITAEQAKPLASDLSFAQYVEIYSAIESGNTEQLSDLLGLVTEAPTINHVKPVLGTSPIPPVPPVAPAKPITPSRPITPTPNVTPPSSQNQPNQQFKPGDKLVVSTQAGDSVGSFSKLLPNGHMEIKTDTNQMQTIDPQDQNFSIAKAMDEDGTGGGTCAGGIASAPSAIGRKSIHIYRKKAK